MAGTIAHTHIAHRSRGVVRTNLAITCDASGVASPTIVGVGFGRLVGVCYDGGLDASAIITLTDTKTGATLLTITAGTEGTPVFYRPTQGIVDNAGATVAAATTAANVNRDIYVAGKLSVGVTAGGVSETGNLGLIVDEAHIGDLANTV